MKQFHSIRFRTDIGTLELSCTGREVVSLRLLSEEAAADRSDGPESDCPVCRDTVRQIREYLRGRRTEFEIPVRLDGNPLCVSVWRALRKVPYGATVSYSELAQAVGCRSVRAVGTAVAKNPLPFLIPCHRVIRKDGSIGQYSFGGPSVKRALIGMERRGRKAP